MPFLSFSTNRYFMCMYRETGLYSSMWLKGCFIHPDIFDSCEGSNNSEDMLDILERVAGTNLYVVMYLWIAHYQQTKILSSESFLTMSYYFKTCFNLHFIIALFASVTVELFGLNKLGFIYHQRNWAVTKRRQFT